MAGSASSDEQRAARHRMWKLLSRQLIGGLGAPREAQLSALWSRYDADHNGCLSKGELGMMMADYAAARADELEAEELPSLQRMMEEHDDNPFVRSLAEARLLSKRAELELYRAQSHGALPAAAVEAAFKQLDTRHDGRVFRDDFLAHATDVFFGIQMERLQAMKDLESADVAAAQQGGAAGELEEPKGR
uniref:EF-hand domain-containing protein n=1 Tax=Chrysotila carterae TaxID=13221 RepID=A0A7S4AYE3_CHRCT|eukprot:4940416-Pleurochrysis_carterae.AAC.1